MPNVQECCCGASLKTGSILIGVFYLCASLGQIGHTAGPLKYREFLPLPEEGFNKLIQPDIEKQIRNTSETLHHDIGLKRTSDKSKSKTVIYVNTTLVIVHLVFLAIDAICDLLLLYGAIWEKATMLLIWLVAETMVLIALTVIRIIVYEDSIGVFVPVIHITFPLALYVYFVLVVYSYYQTLSENRS